LSLSRVPDKAKLAARRGRKATGLEDKTAELPKDDAFGVLGFFIVNKPVKSPGLNIRESTLVAEAHVMRKYEPGAGSYP